MKRRTVFPKLPKVYKKPEKRFEANKKFYKHSDSCKTFRRIFKYLIWKAFLKLTKDFLNLPKKVS